MSNWYRHRTAVRPLPSARSAGAARYRAPSRQSGSADVAGTCGFGMRTRRRMLRIRASNSRASKGFAGNRRHHFRPTTRSIASAARGQHQYGQPGKRWCRAQRAAQRQAILRRAASGPRRQSADLRALSRIRASVFLGGKAWMRNPFFADNRHQLADFAIVASNNENVRCFP